MKKELTLNEVKAYAEENKITRIEARDATMGYLMCVYGNLEELENSMYLSTDDMWLIDENGNLEVYLVD